MCPIEVQWRRTSATLKICSGHGGAGPSASATRICSQLKKWSPFDVMSVSLVDGPSLLGAVSRNWDSLRSPWY